MGQPQFPDDVSNTAQLRKDVHALFGALRCACSSGVGKTILIKHMEAQDGIKAWMEITKKYEADGNKDVRIRKLEKVINTPFDRKMHGGLLAWVQSHENASNEMHPE